MKIIFDNIPIGMPFLFRGGFHSLKVAFDRADVSYPQGNEIAHIVPLEVCEIEDAVADVRGFHPADPMQPWISPPLGYRAPDGSAMVDQKLRTMDEKLARVRALGEKSWTR